MRASLYTTAILFTVIGCSAPAPPPAEPAPEPTAKPTAAPTAKPTAEPKAEPPKPVEPPSLADIRRPAPPKDLEAVAKALSEKKWQGALDALDAKKDAIVQAPVDVRVRARAMRGMAHVMLDDTKSAMTEYRKVMNYWQTAAKKLEQQIGKKDEEAFNKRLEAMNGCFAEALFVLAEEKRAKASAIELQPYDGPAEADKVKKHFDGKVAQWLRLREKAVDKAAKEYGKVESLKPAAPAAWLVASASRVAQMRSELHDALAANEAPEDWAKEAPKPAPAAADGGAPAPADSPAKAAFEQFNTSLKEALEPLATKTMEAFNKCDEVTPADAKDDLAAKYCKSWLEKNQ